MNQEQRAFKQMAMIEQQTQHKLDQIQAEIDALSTRVNDLETLALDQIVRAKDYVKQHKSHPTIEENLAWLTKTR